MLRSLHSLELVMQTTAEKQMVGEGGLLSTH